MIYQDAFTWYSLQHRLRGLRHIHERDYLLGYHIHHSPSHTTSSSASLPAHYLQGQPSASPLYTSEYSNTSYLVHSQTHSQSNSLLHHLIRIEVKCHMYNDNLSAISLILLHVPLPGSYVIPPLPGMPSCVGYHLSFPYLSGVAYPYPSPIPGITCAASPYPPPPAYLVSRVAYPYPSPPCCLSLIPPPNIICFAYPYPSPPCCLSLIPPPNIICFAYTPYPSPILPYT